jgi:hypothetical protein
MLTIDPAAPGAQSARLLAGGDANLAGSLITQFLVFPATGQVFRLIEAGARSGEFQSVEVFGLTPEQTAAVIYELLLVDLEVLGVPEGELEEFDPDALFALNTMPGDVGFTQNL